MGLTQTLATSLSGLTCHPDRRSRSSPATSPTPIRRATSARPSIQVPIGSGDAGIGVRVSAIQRKLDQYVQKQLRAENSGASYADRARNSQPVAECLRRSRLRQLAEDGLQQLHLALQALSASPDDRAARSAVISTAQQSRAAAQRHERRASRRCAAQAEFGHRRRGRPGQRGDGQIAKLNRQSQAIGDDSTATRGPARPARRLHRPAVAADGHQGRRAATNQITSSPIPACSWSAAGLARSFNAQGTVSAARAMERRPDQELVGTLTLNSPNGGSVDLIQIECYPFRQIAAYLQMRDHDWCRRRASSMASPRPWPGAVRHR